VKARLTRLARRGAGLMRWQGLKRWLGFYAPVAMLALLPTMASFLGNRYQVSAQDLILPVVLELATAIIVTGAFYRLWRRDRPAAYLAATLSTLVLASDFDTRISGLSPLFAAITPFAGLTAGPVFALVCVLAILAIAGWLGRSFGRLVERSKWSAKDVASGALVAIVVTFGFMALTLVRDLAVEWPQFFYKPPQLAAAPTSAKAAAKPDIYYIVMEDYAGSDAMKQQFGFDNADFTNFLKDSHYYVDPSANINYPYTTMSVASTMSADYLNDLIGKFGKSSEQTVVPFNETVRNAPVAQHLKSIGYSYYEIGNWYEAFNLSPLADKSYQTTGRFTVLGHTYTLNNFSKLTLTQSLFSRLVQSNLRVGKFNILAYQNMGDVELAHYELGQLRQLASGTPGGRFIFTDILIPHQPFTFNADGSLNPNSSSDNVGESAKQKYVNNVKYINEQMKGILSKIEEKSGGQAVVVLLSDEGPEPFELNHGDEDQLDVDGELQAGDMRKWSAADLRLKMNTQAAFRIPQANVESDAASQAAADNVNVFRLILNTYFGESLPYLPDCNYVYPDGRNKPIGFASVTSKLTGQPEDGRCRADGTASP
jgi:hypothetical protein